MWRYLVGLCVGLATVTVLGQPSRITQPPGAADIRMTSGTQIFLPDGDSTNPALTFTSDPDSGMHGGSANALSFTLGGTKRHEMTTTQYRLLSSAGAFTINDDVVLARDGAANILAQRNSTNAQKFRLYESYTSASVGYGLSIDSGVTAATTVTITPFDLGGGGGANQSVTMKALGTGVVTLGSPSLIPRAVEVVTTTKTTTYAESYEVYTNTGDGDGSTITLLNDPTIGAQWTFVATAAQTITIVASTGETIEDSGATCGTSYTLTDGQSVTMVAATGGSGAQFHAVGGNGTCNA